MFCVRDPDLLLLPVVFTVECWLRFAVTASCRFLGSPAQEALLEASCLCPCGSAPLLLQGVV